MAQERRVGVTYEVKGMDQVVRANQIWQREMAATRKTMTAAVQSAQEFSRSALDIAKSITTWGTTAKSQRAAVSHLREEIARLQGMLNQYRFSTEKLTETDKMQVAALRARIAELRQAEQALGRQAAATAELERTQRRQGQEAERAAKQQTRETEKAARAQQQQTKALAMNIKHLALWTLGARTAFRLYVDLRNELRDAFLALYENTEQWKRLQAATDKASKALVSAYVASAGGLGSIDLLAQGVEKLQFALAGLGAIGAGSMRVLLVSMANLDWMFREIAAGTLTLEEATERFQASLDEIDATMIKTFNTVIAESSKGTDETQKYESALGSVISATRQWNESLRAHEERIADIRERYREAAQAARDEWFAELTRINRELADKIADINEEADQDRLDAFDRFNRDMAKAQQRANKELESDAERHALEMEFARRRHQLSMIQNERVYQYERNLLVAEGDVLAIENLDARHQLEQQAQDENFRLQMEQAEAMFRLQARVQAEAAREQAAILRQSLDERLREIEEERDKEVAEAEEAAAEERMIASQEYKATAADLKEQQEEQLADEEKNYQRRIENAGEFWADFAREYGLGVDEVLRITKALFGDQGELEQAIRDTYSQTATVSTLFAQAWTNAMNQVKSAVTTTELAFRSLQTTMSATMATSYSPYGYPSRGRPRGRQYGGEDIVSTPTHFVAGEAYMPERVTVEPLSPLMGNVTLSWSGGAIPVHGTGTMAGADTTEVMNELAQGLIIAVNDRLLGLRGQRGY